VFNAAAEKRDKAGRGTPEAEAAQKEVSEAMDKMYAGGYYRDSYNATNCLNRVGLSWWADVVPLCRKKDGRMGLRNLKKFRNMVAKAPLKPVTREQLLANHATVDDGENSVEAWNKYYADGIKELIAFLDKAIELKEPIDCSL
jgi:hypothetical protein